MMKRTHADSKYRPIRRSVTRYGRIEKALGELKREIQDLGKKNKVKVSDITLRANQPSTHKVAGILKFTKGLRYIGRGDYEFTGERIRVDNAGG